MGRRTDAARPPRRTLLALRAALVVALIGLGGCSSTAELSSLQTQLGEIQRQILQLQRQSPSREEVADLGGRLSASLDQILRSDADLSQELREIATRLDRLQAQVDETNNGLVDLSKTLGSTQEDLVALQQAWAELSTSGTRSEEGPPAAADPQDLYRAAYNDYLRGNYDLAITGFRRYLDLYSASDLADNALYWIAESFFSQGQFRQAIDEFGRITALYPTSERLASALLRQGYAWLELNNEPQARQVLSGVIENYRGSDEAILAQRQLDNLDD